MKTVKKWMLVFAGFAALLLTLWLVPFREWLEPVFEELESAGAWGMVGFVVLGTLLTIAFLPVSVVVLMSGMLFGVRVGFGLASVILILGSLLGFWGGQILWPRIQHRKMFQVRMFRAIRKAIEQEGLQLVAWLRMTPVFHFMTGNLFFGSLDLKWFPYLGFSYLGMIPGTLLMVYAGSVTSRSIADSDGVTYLEIGYFVVGLAVLGWVSRKVTLSTKRVLQEVDAGVNIDV